MRDGEQGHDTMRKERESPKTSWREVTYRSARISRPSGKKEANSEGGLKKGGGGGVGGGGGGVGGVPRTRKSESAFRYTR